MEKFILSELVVGDHKFALKDFKCYDELSDETLCFTAKLVADGKVVGEANNRGCGGPTDFYCYEEHRDFVKSIEQVVSGYHRWPEEESLQNEMFDVESIAEDLAYKCAVYEEIMEKVRKSERTSIVLFNEGNGTIRTYKAGASLIKMMASKEGSEKVNRIVSENAEQGYKLCNSKLEIEDGVVIYKGK